MGIWDDIKMGFGAEPKTKDFIDRTAETMARNARSSDDMRGQSSKAKAAAGKNAYDTYQRQMAAGGLSAYFGGFGGSAGRDPRDRSRSTFRNPGPQQGILGKPGLLSGGDNLGLSDIVPFGGLINLLTKRPVDSGKEYTYNTQKGTGPGVSPPTQRQMRPRMRPDAFASRVVDTTYLNDQPPGMPMTSMNPLNFTNDEAAQGFDLSQPDSAFAGVPPSQRSELDPLLPASVETPIAGFPPADGVVSVEDAAFQEWLATDGNNATIQQWEKTNPGFARRMFDRSQFLKRGGGVNSEGNM